MELSPVSQWLRGVSHSNGLARGDSVESQLLKQQLEASKAEVANLRLQLRVSEKAAGVASRSAASVARPSPMSRVEAYIAQQRRMERDASEVPADRWAAHVDRRLSDPLGPPNRFCNTRKEEQLLDACIERERLLQEMRTDLDTQRYLLVGDGRFRSSRALQELQEAQLLIREQRREIQALRGELAAAERRERTSHSEALRGQKEVIDLQEALIQEKSFEIDRLRKLLQEQKSQIALLQAAAMRSASSSVHRSPPPTSGHPPGDSSPTRTSPLFHDRPPSAVPEGRPLHSATLHRSPAPSTTALSLRPLGSPRTSIPHLPDHFDDPPLPVPKWWDSTPPPDPPAIGSTHTGTPQVPERNGSSLGSETTDEGEVREF
eukprot:GGOE01049647.1.p1 GENE.GGOE01049647.1~~GGOE01049647.1.p1  ORF type:complete len:376 (-),score=84.45 GGOE01049647.1:276-1403(-)